MPGLLDDLVDVPDQSLDGLFMGTCPRAQEDRLQQYLERHQGLAKIVVDLPGDALALFFLRLDDPLGQMLEGFFHLFTPGDVVTDRDVLARLAVLIQKRNNGRIDPITGAVFGAVSDLPMPNLSAGYSAPEIPHKFFGMIS